AVIGVVRAAINATDILNADRNKDMDVAMKGTGSSAAVVKEAIPRGTLDYKLYSKEAKALLTMIHDAKLTELDTSPAVVKRLDYAPRMDATGKPKNQLGGE